MTISFNSIPVGGSILTPGQYVEFDNTGANQSTPAKPNKILVLGQMLPTGSAVANTPQRVPNEAAATALFGQGSMISHMLKQVKRNNPFTELWAIGVLDNAAGVQASGTVTFAGSPTVAGTYQLYIGYNVAGIGGGVVQIPAAVGATPTTLAAALAAAINLNTDLPVTATSAVGVVTITARHKGVAPNDIDLRNTFFPGDAVPAGLTATIVGMAGGTTNPVLTAAIAATGTDWYNHWVMPWTDAASLLAIQTELDRRNGPLVMQEGHCYVSAAGTQSQVTTLALTLNTHEFSIMAGQKSPTPTYMIAAALCGIAAYYSDIDPARPLQTLQLVNVAAPAIADRFIQSDRNLCLTNGVATFVVDAGGNVLIERVVTTYRLNAAGLPDTSYLDVESLYTIFYLRYSVRSRISQRFPRYKLANDGTPFGPGQAIVTPSIIRYELIALASEWADKGLVEDMAQFKRDLIVERDVTDVNRINSLLPPNLVNQFRTFAGQIRFIL